MVQMWHHALRAAAAHRWDGDAGQVAHANRLEHLHGVLIHLRLRRWSSAHMPQSSTVTFLVGLLTLCRLPRSARNAAQDVQHAEQPVPRCCQAPCRTAAAGRLTATASAAARPLTMLCRWGWHKRLCPFLSRNSHGRSRTVADFARARSLASNCTVCLLSRQPVSPLSGRTHTAPPPSPKPLL